MKLLPRQKIWLAVVLTANVLVWSIPSDVIELVARQREIFLGRYSQTHFYWIIAVAMLSIVSFYIDWSRGDAYKRRWFQVLASVFMFVPLLALADFLIRSPGQAHYVKDRFAYHRPANWSITATFEDLPEARGSFPESPGGHPPVACTLTTDARGFRNTVALEQADVVVLGDSFAEGSSVSDEHVWARRVGEAGALSVYNLGMSGYDPLNYLESLKDFGVALKPRVVLCLLYEGNDFRSAKSDAKRLSPSLSKRLEEYLDRSPILQALDNLLIRTFEQRPATHRIADIEALDWLPLAVPHDGNTRYYFFEPKQLRDLWESREEFSADKHWLNPRGQMGRMRELCREIGAQFAVVYAPTKAHVTLPMVAEKLPAEKVRGFTSMGTRAELPPANKFLTELVQRSDDREEVVREWCIREGIAFVPLTTALRDATAAGHQTYYTFDQHWTPAGHEVVAQVVLDFLRGALAPSVSGAARATGE